MPIFTLKYTCSIRKWLLHQLCRQTDGYIVLVSETGDCYWNWVFSSPVGLKLTMLPRMNLNFWSFCFYLLSTGLTWSTMSTSLQILNLLPSFLSVYKGSSKLHSRVMLLAHTMVAEGVCKLWLYRTTHLDGWGSNWDKGGKSNAPEWPNYLSFLFQKFYFYLLFVCMRETEKGRDWETERVIEKGKGREIEGGRRGRHTYATECVGVRERPGGVGTLLHLCTVSRDQTQVTRFVTQCTHCKSFLIFQFRWFLVLLFLVPEGVDLQDYF